MLVFCSSLLIACSAGNSESKPNEGSEMSTACTICLLTDSLSDLDKQMATKYALNEPVDGLRELIERIESEVDSLRTVLKNEPGIGLSSPYDVCGEEHPFDKIENKEEREQLFINYWAYDDLEYDIPHYLVEEDTAEFKKENGFYLVKNKGVYQRVPFDQFPDYWENVQTAYDNIESYISKKKNESVEPMGGKKIESLSKIELLMFEFHAGEVKYSKEVEIKEKRRGDSEYQDLIHAFWLSRDYRREETP